MLFSPERLTGKNVMIYDYPDGNIAIKYLGRSLEFTAFDHLEVIRQGEIVENKRLREVLKFAMTEQERLESDGPYRILIFIVVANKNTH
ncbi:hypothetical protein Vc3S01_p30057 (plasmid) [Vibrio campbellii]|nr:hypothetical protein Vc3S01_p30057 [Vibrio campbellii]